MILSISAVYQALCSSDFDPHLVIEYTPRGLQSMNLFLQAESAAEAVKTDPTKFSGKKSKAASKLAPKVTRQWDILRTSGIPEADIPKFV